MTTGQTPMIRVENLIMRFGRDRAVDGVSLDVAPGESIALWGSNGAGKTTILRSILGLLPYQGRITVGGHDVRGKGKVTRRLLGYVPQELGFNDDLRVAEAVVFFARLKGVKLAGVESVLERVGLPGQGRKRMRELSGGMKQRLALALALLGDPPILILDEVTASLDACGREELVALLEGLRGSGRSMLFASHRVEEVAALAHRVIYLERGKIVKESAAGGLIQGDGHPTLHLHIESAIREQALQLLESSGFAPTRNGVGLLVPVPREQKAGPFRVLAEGRVPVSDFEVLWPNSSPGVQHKEAAS